MITRAAQAKECMLRALEIEILSREREMARECVIVRIKCEYTEVRETLSEDFGQRVR